MDTTKREELIRNYIAGYNAFDIDRMVAHFDEAVLFENCSGGVVNLSLSGLDAFREQAERAKEYFSTRTQTIRSFAHREHETEVAVDYHALLAIDLPGGPKRGEALQLQGRSIFHFSGARITRLTDIS
ncbi:MAG: nuclear transport factor 2 family protein [Chitinophagaceae bacterium]|nr:MAG: nuclear transport factor 2 family protein [Chitinophagaceae bacterium]